MLIVGEREIKNRTVSVRKRFEGDHGEVEIASFTKSLKKIINNRSITHRKEADATSE
jgi:threonyl-tRNA synthetase